jgi:HTH-type transcriptional repressor of NAD biosynthesis genes
LEEDGKRSEVIKMEFYSHVSMPTQVFELEKQIETQKLTVGFIGGKFLPLHLGNVYAIMQASSMVDELYVILMSANKSDRDICKHDKIKYMPANVRLSWLGQEFSDIENIKILHVPDELRDTEEGWDSGANLIKQGIGKTIDYIFSSESIYDSYFSRLYPKAKHIVLDEERKNVPISATRIRRDIYKHWDMLPSSVREYFTKKVVVIGTESCGKSTLVKKLSKIYDAPFVQEIGRQYCIKYADKLTREMFNDIAMEHYLTQQKNLGNKLLFVDSDATITQFYLDMYFEKQKSPLIEEIIKLQDYDLAIFLEPDVRWVADGFRASGEEEIRLKNNTKMKKMFDERGIIYFSINGDYLERFLKSKNLVDKLF